MSEARTDVRIVASRPEMTGRRLRIQRRQEGKDGSGLTTVVIREQRHRWLEFIAMESSDQEEQSLPQR